MITQVTTDDDDGNHISNGVLDLSVRKRLSVLLSPPSSTASSSSSSSVISPQQIKPTGKRMLDLNTIHVPFTSKVQQTNKRPLRFQCKHCDYKAPSTSLMQNHIYRHTDLTPYACAYCGHKSTTKSTIMVHIELCHPNMEVKIHENRVREQDFYYDLNNSEAIVLSSTTPEPAVKKRCCSGQYDSAAEPINGVAIALNTLIHDGNELSPVASEDLYDVDHLESMLLPTADLSDDDNTERGTDITDSLTLKFSPQSTSPVDTSSPVDTKAPDSEDDGNYLLVYNRPKQFYGSLYEPDKQYACRLCSYTTNHRPSMEDHVFVHTNERPYKCGYCGEEIYTRYAATYHIKYKHTGMPRNFIQNKADITRYYVNRAKKDEEKNQFKVVDTRRVKVPVRHGKVANQPQNLLTSSLTHSTPHEISPPPPPAPTAPIQAPKPRASSPPSTSVTTPATPDYRFLLTWSYYLATQAAWLSPLLQQQGQSPLSPPTDPETAAKFLQAMQTMMNSSGAAQHSNNIRHHEQSNSEPKRMSPSTKERSKKP